MRRWLPPPRWNQLRRQVSRKYLNRQKEPSLLQMQRFLLRMFRPRTQRLPKLRRRLLQARGPGLVREEMPEVRHQREHDVHGKMLERPLRRRHERSVRCRVRFQDFLHERDEHEVRVSVLRRFLARQRLEGLPPLRAELR